jgi:hypothetical protein
MGLLNTHPDYLRDPELWNIYVDFLETMKARGGYWHALPCDVARWWRRRAEAPVGQELPETTLGTVLQENDQISHSYVDFSEESNASVQV